MTPSYIIYDNAFSHDSCLEAASQWPLPDWDGWHATYHSDQQKKRACNQWQSMPNPVVQLLWQMLFLDIGRFFPRLLPDMSLWGGGMHDMGQGDVLGLHLDADHHAVNGLNRTVNGILFLSQGWDNNWGGNLEIWDQRKTRPLLSIAPQFNRLVLFATNDTSWHTVTALTCPDGVRRKTLAVWWYSLEASNNRRQRALFLNER